MNSRRTFKGDLFGGLNAPSSNSNDTGRERARRLAMWPLGEITSATSSFALVVCDLGCLRMVGDLLADPSSISHPESLAASSKSMTSGSERRSLVKVSV